MHGALEAPATLKVPAAHTVKAEDAAGQYEPAGQVTQVEAAVAPVASEYVPSGHCFGLVIPIRLQ